MDSNGKGKMEMEGIEIEVSVSTERREEKHRKAVDSYVRTAVGLCCLVTSRGDLSHFRPLIVPLFLPPSAPPSIFFHPLLCCCNSLTRSLHARFQMAVIIPDMKSHFSSAWLLQSS